MSEVKKNGNILMINNNFISSGFYVVAFPSAKTYSVCGVYQEDGIVVLLGNPNPVSIKEFAEREKEKQVIIVSKIHFDNEEFFKAHYEMRNPG